MRPGLIGRDSELARLDEILATLSRREARFVELVGEPGIGKTRLLEVLAERGRSRGCRVLRGRAAQFEQDAPFHVFVDALDDHLASMNPRRRRSLGAELAAVFPSLAEIGDGSAVALASEERYRIHRAVRSLIGLLGAEQPLALVLDDAHWCDQASLELLRHIVRRPPRGAVLIALAYRTGTMPSSWETVADAAVREGDLTRIEVGPLSREDADLLLAQRVDDPHLRTRVFEATGGNPFFLRQVAEAPRAAVTHDASARGREGVPKAVLAAIGEEVASLAEPTRLALRGAVIAGDPFDPGDAAVAAGMPEADLLPHLDELARRGLVRSGDSPRELQFRHPVLWRGVYEGCPVGWRIAAHRRLADHLAARGAGPAARAPHVEAAAQPGDREAAAVLREAAEAALVRAPASAASWFQAALRLLPEDAGERVGLLVALAKTLGSIGRIAESRDRLREAIGLIPAEAEAARVEAVVACATMENLLRNLPEATRLLTRELESLGDSKSAHAASILVALATLHVFDYEQEHARDWGQRALELAARHGLRLIETAALGVLAYNEGRVGNVRRSLALIERAGPMVDAVPRDAAAANLDGIFWVVVAEMQAERFEDAVRHGDRVRELARATGQGRWLPQIAAGRAWSLWGLGRLDEAIAAVEEGIEMAQLTGNRQFEALMLCACGQIMTPAGRLREALAECERAIHLAGPVAEGDYISMYARQNAAVAMLESGDPAGARERLREIVDEQGVPRTEPLWQPFALGLLAEAELRLGNLEAAERCASHGKDLAETLGLAARRCWAMQAQARVQLARGEASAAAETARGAAAAAAAAKARIDEGRSLTLQGGALAAAGDKQAAARVLRRAYELLDASGATHFRDAAARELRALGQRVTRRGARAGAAELTERERGVAELVAEGRTNREIAGTLHVSEKTVEKHLARVFEKLGVSRRGAVGPRLTQK